jgi:hypothetical protein
MLLGSVHCSIQTVQTSLEPLPALKHYPIHLEFISRGKFHEASTVFEEPGEIYVKKT